jgi:hypothetical protein
MRIVPVSIKFAGAILSVGRVGWNGALIVYNAKCQQAIV